MRLQNGSKTDFCEVKVSCKSAKLLNTFAQGWRNGEEKIIELTNVETDDEGKVALEMDTNYCVMLSFLCFMFSSLTSTLAPRYINLRWSFSSFV